MAVEGTLDLFKLPEILQLVAQQRKTGILTVQGQHDIVAISFLSGRIVAADALNQPMEEGLARMLVAERMMSPHDVARASAEHQEAGGRLLDLLVDRGYVARPQLLEALRMQTRWLVEQLLRWDEGDFKFYSGEEVSYEDAFVPIPVEEVLLHAAELEQEALASARPAAAAAPRPSVAAAAAATVPAAEPRPRPRLVAVPRPAPAPVPSPAAPRAAPAPEPTPAAFRRMKVEEAAVPRSLRGAARLLALVPVVLLAGVLTTVPQMLVLPFPWQDGQRSALARAQRAALFLKIDRAAKTFYLAEGRFPERLSTLRDAGLLGRGDLADPQGQPLAYQPFPEKYVLQPLDDRGAPLPGAQAEEGITGNFLLDAQFTSVSPDDEVPLVLLD